MSDNTFKNALIAMCEAKDALEGMAYGETKPLSAEELRHAKAMVQQCVDMLDFIAEEGCLDINLSSFCEDDAINEVIDELQEVSEELAE